MGRTIFADANLLDGGNPAQKGASIVVEDGRITAITAGAPAPGQADDTVVDMRGLTLMPGMVSGHFHAAYSQVLTMDAPETTQAYQALGNAQTALNCGYTSVVGAGTFFDIDARLADAIDSGTVVGPRLIPSSRALSPSVVGGGNAEDSPYLTNQGPEAFREAALREIEAGAKVLKIFAASGHALLGTRDMSAGEITAVVEVAHDHGVRVRAHVGGRDHVLECVRLGVDIIDHADGMDDECVKAILEHDCFVLPSLYFGFLTARDSSLPGAELYDPKDFEQMRRVLPKAADAGVKFVPGDDYGYGALAHGDYSGELACYVEQAGISPLEVIKWATKNGGELTGIADLSTIAPGNLADLLIVDGDPSVDINVLSRPECILAVVKGGALVSGKLPIIEPSAELEMAV